MVKNYRQSHQKIAKRDFKIKYINYKIGGSRNDYVEGTNHKYIKRKLRYISYTKNQKEFYIYKCKSFK